ncbi:hypothetical protein EMPS_09951 [Entomortierella parvispora]|uniref:XPG-I domain-containing protein n=1 Tax=Entomortierella parvispora TaxID=205924 RepID=A0A9P3HJ47_9FUNG|nr:hypothetical protein EMPS_09951 [Entomortierella parvispora]
MGVPFLWPFVKKKGYFPDVLSNCPQHSRPPNTTFHVDILGSMYPLIRRTFLKHDPVMANSIFEMKLRSLKFPPATTLLYMDGPSPEEKRATRALREARCSTSLTKADSLLHEMEDMFRQKKKLKKQQFRKLNKGLNAAFYLSADLGESLAQFLIAKGWSVIQCPSEADIQIALNCRTEDIVVSGDSDSLVHLSSITTIWRPLARGGYLEYDVPKLLIHLQLTRAGLTALGVVCRNDYSCNLKQMGIVTNYEVLQSLRDKDPPLDVNELIRAYLTHPEVIIKDPGNSYFDSALKVFARQEFTFWDQTLLPQACYEDTMNQPRSSPSLTEITARLRSLQSQLKTVRSEGSSSNLPVAHTGDIEYKFNRYNTVDSQPAISPSPHASGRKYKYRQRYAIKTRSRIIEHDPPDVLKQYTLKPWTEPPPRPVLPTTTKSSESVTKDPPNFRTMDKMRLVKELQRQHPLRVMDTARLAAFKAKYKPHSTDQSSSTDQLSYTDQTSSSDQIPSVEQKNTASNADKAKVKKEKGDSDSVCAVREFLIKAKDFLPPQNGNAAGPYPSSSVLQSTALNLTIEYMKHYKHGSLDLCKKIRALKKKGILPPNTVDNIDLKLSPVENFIILNRITGSKRCVTPISPMDSTFVNISELDLIKLFWQDQALKEQLQKFAFHTVNVHRFEKITQDVVAMWLGYSKPGLLINSLLSDIGGYSAEERKKKRSFSRSARTMSLPEVMTHLSNISQATFDPKTYAANGYLLRGSIRTDGFRLQVLGFKLNELNCVKYRRLAPEKLPDRIASTLGGLDYYLTEIRNVVKSKEDVHRLWGDGVDPEKIKILGIDLGQAFVVGASAILPSQGGATAIPAKQRFFNLSVKQKAVYQPVFRHRSWLEHRKKKNFGRNTVGCRLGIESTTCSWSRGIYQGLRPAFERKGCPARTVL